MNGNPHEKWIYGLDSLRFILASWVLFDHLGSPIVVNLDVYNSNAFHIISAISNNFFVGVSAVIAFFVISGIVIHYPYVKSELLSIEFISRRYVRILIPMGIIYILAYSLNKPDSLWPFWSLYCELVYYTLYPLFHFLIKKYGNFPLVAVSFIFAIIVVVTQTNSMGNFFFQNNINYVGNFHGLGVFFTWIVGLPAWLLGVSIAERLKSPNNNWIFSNKSQLISLRIAILLLSILASIGRFHFHLSYLISLLILSIPIAFWIFEELHFMKKTKLTHLFENAGKWSYSIYICHSLIISCLTDVFNISEHAFLDWVFLLVFSFMLSFLFYFFVEKPSHNLSKMIRIR